MANDHVDDNDLSDVEEKELKLLFKDIDLLKPTFERMTDECLREICLSETENPIYKLVAKLESLSRYGIGQNDNIH